MISVKQLRSEVNIQNAVVGIERDNFLATPGAYNITARASSSQSSTLARPGFPSTAVRASCDRALRQSPVLVFADTLDLGSEFRQFLASALRLVLGCHHAYLNFVQGRIIKTSVSVFCFT